VKVPELKIASINIKKALMNISLTTLATIGSALNPMAAGATALVAAVAVPETLSIFLKPKKEEQLELPAPPFWSSSAQSWQTVCSSIEYRLPMIMDTVAAQLKQIQGMLTEAIVKQILIQVIAQQLPAWDIPIEQRAMVAVYVARLIITNAIAVLRPILDQMQNDAQLDMIVKIFHLLSEMQQRVLAMSSVMPAEVQIAPVVLSVEMILEQKEQALAYDVYICYNEEDEVFFIG
jgi:hypothetical protein